MSDGLKLNLSLPVLSVEEQLKIRSGTGKAAIFWFNPDGTAVTWWSNLTYMEKLFVIDSFQKRLEFDMRQEED